MTSTLTPAIMLEKATALAVSQTERIQTLDILRGVALLGILSINILTFGLSGAALPQLIRGPHDSNYWLYILISCLFAGKMRALFSMLFGAGVILFLVKKQQPGQLNPIELFVRRQLWLMVFGVVNAYVLIWQWDILFHYGIVGILLFSFRRKSPRILLLGAVLIGLIYSGKNYWTFAEQKAKYEKYQTVVALEKADKALKLTDEQKDDKAAWEELVKNTTYDAKTEKAELKAMRSDYTTVWNYRVPRIQRIQAAGFYQIWLWDIASLMLLGMALFKWGFFSNRLTTRQYVLLAIGGLLIGQTMAWGSLPSFALRSIDFSRYVTTNILPVYGVLMPFERAFSAVGWASLVVLLYRMGIEMWLWKGLRAIGQMAFTNYLMQSVMGTLFFNGYGLGYFGELEFYQLYIVVAEIWLIQIVFSVFWLNYFHFGPLEWLWRSLTYGKRQPIALTQATTSSTTSVLP